MLDATLILVNYRTEKYLLATLAHLQALPGESPLRVIVVDNSPSAFLPEKLTLTFPRVQYIPSRRNLGFAGGVNLGLEHVEGEFVILLNPDAHPEPGCFSGLMSVLANRPEAAVAGPKLVPFDQDEPLCASATRCDPNLLTALVEYTPFRRIFDNRWLWDHYWLNPVTIKDISSCAMVQGACLVIEKSWLERMRGFDSDRFFLYFEETDFCRRIRLKGGDILYCPQFLCRHQGGASLKDRRQDTGRFWKSFYNFHLKHYGQTHALILRGLLTAGLACEYVLCLLKKRLFFFDSDRKMDEYLKVVAERLTWHLGGRFDDA